MSLTERFNLPKALQSPVDKNIFNLAMDRLAATILAGGYLVDPANPGAFVSVEDAVRAAEEDNPGVIKIVLANGFDHNFPAGILDTENEYIFTALPDDNASGGLTVLSGTLDCKATTKPASGRRAVVFHNIITDLTLTVRENREAIYHRGLFRNSTISVEHGTDGVGLYFLQVQTNNGQQIFELDTPSPLNSFLVAVDSNFLLTDFFGDSLQLGGFTSVQFLRHRFNHWSFALNYWFDFRNLAPKVQFQNCLFQLAPSANHLLFKNAASAEIYWQGRNSFVRTSGTGTGTFAVDFTGPTHRGPEAPVVATGASSIGTPLGTRKLDDSDDGGTWKYLSWNGTLWV